MKMEVRKVSKVAFYPFFFFLSSHLFFSFPSLFLLTHLNEFNLDFKSFFTLCWVIVAFEPHSPIPLTCPIFYGHQSRQYGLSFMSQLTTWASKPINYVPITRKLIPSWCNFSVMHHACNGVMLLRGAPPLQWHYASSRFGSFAVRFIYEVVICSSSSSLFAHDPSFLVVHTLIVINPKSNMDYRKWILRLVTMHMYRVQVHLKHPSPCPYARVQGAMHLITP